MGRKFASQAHLGLITWDGRESFESHVVQDWFSDPGLDGSPLGFEIRPHILGNTGGWIYYGVHLGYPSFLPPEFH